MIPMGYQQPSVASELHMPRTVLHIHRMEEVTMMKTINNSVMKVAAVAVIAVGTAMAQGPGFGRWSANSQTSPQNMAGLQLGRMTTLLSLDVGQQQQAKIFFDKASADSQALQPALLQAQTALHNAVRTGENIATLSAAAGKLMGQMQAIRVTALAGLYSILTPAQRDQLDKLQGAGVCMGLGNCPGGGMGMMGGGAGMGMRGRGGVGMMGGGFGPGPRQ
jgi:Spy/CpxP family protein refolding chaperone